MTPLMIVNLIIALGPTALELIQKLAAIWSKPSLTVDEVVALCAPAKKSYDEYIAEAKAALVPPVLAMDGTRSFEITNVAGTMPEVCAPGCECNPSVPVDIQPVTTETATPEPASPAHPPVAPE